jgi:hypothetical protein
MPRPRIIARFRLGKVSIDVYDPSALRALLEWAERVGAETPRPGPGAPAEPEEGPAEEPGGGEPAEIPEFVRGNPWLAVIAGRA